MDLMPHCSCGYDTKSCSDRWEGHYYGKGANAVAGIRLDESFDSLMARVHNGKRDAKYADKAGCTTGFFQYPLYHADLNAIHHSKEVRCGGPMKGHYREYLDESQPQLSSVVEQTCPYHWRKDFGIFAEGHLVGYIGLVRVGDTATYMQIMGHGDWLDRGIMFRLHFDLMEWALSSPPELEGVDAVWYTDFRGPKGLSLWKRKAGFQEVWL